MKLKRAVIIGMGLIGGSIAKALMVNDLAEEVVGVCRRGSSLERARKAGTLTEGYVNNYEKAISGADVVFIATPVHAVIETIKALAEVSRDKKLLVTDVGSTKQKIVDCAEQFENKFCFVGGHPLAGSEKTGVEYAACDLFRGSLCVLTPGKTTNAEALKKAQLLWQDMGARVDVITPDVHDKILAFTSHLPHVVAYALAGVQDPAHAKYMSTGLKDTTRVASSDPALWRDILMSNRENVAESIKRFRQILSTIDDDINNDRQKELEEKLKKCKETRDDSI